MCRSLYSKGRYPNGHPDLARSLNDLGFLLAAQGSNVEAAVIAGQGTDMQQSLSRTMLVAPPSPRQWVTWPPCH